MRQSNTSGAAGAAGAAGAGASSLAQAESKIAVINTRTRQTLTTKVNSLFPFNLILLMNFGLTLQFTLFSLLSITPFA